MTEREGTGAIVYYSLTGHSARLAEALAARTGARLFRLDVARYHTSGLRFLSAATDSLRGRLPPLTETPQTLDGFAWVVVGGPVWTTFPATPLRSFLSSGLALPRPTGLFLTCSDTKPPQKAFAMCEALLGRPADARLHVSDKTEDSPDTSDRIGAFCARLGAAEPALVEP